MYGDGPLAEGAIERRLNCSRSVRPSSQNTDIKGENEVGLIERLALAIDPDKYLGDRLLRDVGVQLQCGERKVRKPLQLYHSALDRLHLLTGDLSTGDLSNRAQPIQVTVYDLEQIRVAAPEHRNVRDECLVTKDCCTCHFEAALQGVECDSDTRRLKVAAYYRNALEDSVERRKPLLPVHDYEVRRHLLGVGPDGPWIGGLPILPKEQVSYRVAAVTWSRTNP